MTRSVAEMLEDFEPVIGLEVHVQLATKTKAIAKRPRATTKEDEKRHTRDGWWRAMNNERDDKTDTTSE